MYNLYMFLRRRWNADIDVAFLPKPTPTRSVVPEKLTKPGLASEPKFESASGLSTSLNVRHSSEPSQGSRKADFEVGGVGKSERFLRKRRVAIGMFNFAVARCSEVDR